MRTGFKAFVIVFFIFLGSRIGAQTFALKNYSANQGLPSSEVYNSIQDEQGYIWFATDRGIAKYDGYSFKTLTTQEGLTDNTVFEFFKDSKQQLWCKTFSSTINRISNDSAYPYKYNNLIQTLFPTEILKELFFDKKGDLFFAKGSEEQGISIFRIDKSGKLDTFNKRQVKERPIREVYLSDNGRCLVGGDIIAPTTDIFELGNKEKIISFTHEIERGDPFSKKINNNYIICINQKIFILKDKKIKKIWDCKGETLYFFIDKDENFWIGYRSLGFEFLSAKSGYTKAISGLNNHSISSLSQDKEGGIWITTLEKGVFYLAPSAPLVYTKEQGLSTEKINKIVNVGGNIVALTSDDQLLLKDKNSSVFKSIWGKKRYATDIAYSEKNGIFTFYPTTELIAPQQKHTIILAHKKIFFGTRYLWGVLYKKITKFTPQGEILDSIPFNQKRVLCVEELTNGDLLVGTIGGLYIYKNKQVTSLSSASPLFNLRVSDIKQLDSNHVVIATLGGGILITQINNYKNTIQYKTDRGLPSIMCNTLLKINDSTLWVGTNRGLCRVNNILQPDKSIFTGVDINNGLVSNEVNNICEVDGKLWVATAAGISILNQKTIGQVNSSIPIYIKKININGEETPLLPLLKLAYNQNNIAFSFIGLNYQYAGQLVYKYRLLGAETKWNTTTNLSVLYNTLPYGEYTFEIGVMRPRGSAPTQFVKYHFTILPPLWLEPWFIVFVVALLALLIYWYIRYRVNFVRKQEQLNVDLNTFRDRALRGQMNPHFIYNSLNSIQNYMLKSDTMASVSFLSKFSQLMRLTFNNTAQELITLEKDMEALLLYIELEDLRFQHKFTVHIENSSNLDFSFIKVPPLILQPFVENAIQHGLLTKTGGGNIWISFIKHPDSIEITIQDDGIGRANAKKIQERKARFKARLVNAFGRREYTGITATQTRIQQAWGNKFSKNQFKIVDLTTDNGLPKGTLVHIFLPLYD